MRWTSRGCRSNEAGRAKADSWNVSVQTLPERQCIPHPAPYGLNGPANLHIYSELDPATGQPLVWNIFGTFGRATLTVWMDGRPHPSANALHTYEGFTTGEWEGDTLTTHTTHIKMGYLRRNGVPHQRPHHCYQSFRPPRGYPDRHHDRDDPIYLSEPMIRSHNWVLDPNQTVLPTPCEPVVRSAASGRGGAALPAGRKSLP